MVPPSLKWGKINTIHFSSSSPKSSPILRTLSSSPKYTDEAHFPHPIQANLGLTCGAPPTTLSRMKQFVAPSMGATGSRAPITFPKRQGLLLFVDAGAGAGATGLSLTEQGREIHIHEREGTQKTISQG
jgi:hypothetical protein